MKLFKRADKEQSKMGWILDYDLLTSISEQTLDVIRTVSREDVEAVLLVVEKYLSINPFLFCIDHKECVVETVQDNFRNDDKTQ